MPQGLGPPNRELAYLVAAGLPTNDISRDGRATLFTRFDEGAGLEYQIGFRRLDASSTTSLGTGQAVALSPDSKSALGITFGQPGIFVLPTGPGERRVLTRPGFKYTFGGWFPDGKRILFVAEHSNELPAAYAQDLDGADPRKVPSLVPALSGGAIALRVSPDSQWFFGPQAGAVPIIVPIDHGLPRTLTMLTRNDSLLEWTPDGHGVLVGRKAQDQSSVTIARLDLQSGRLDTLKTVRIGDTGGIRAFGLLVTPDGRSIVYTIQRYLTDLYLVEGLK